MAIKPHRGFTQHSRPLSAGFTLLIAVIFVSVFLALGLSLGSLDYKQTVLASSATQSQYAFYAADAALECALFIDQQSYPGNTFGLVPANNPFIYANHGKVKSFSCGSVAKNVSEVCYDGNNGCAPSLRGVTVRMPIAFSDPTNPAAGSETLCADVTVYESLGGGGGTTYLFAQGYDVSCVTMDNLGATARITARGLQAHY